MKEKILEAFANLGFKLEDADGMGYVFDYEGIRFLYMYNENDENFCPLLFLVFMTMTRTMPLNTVS